VYDSDFDRNEFPIAYLITVRCFGTWLHGDERLAVDRHGLNVYGRRRRPENSRLEEQMVKNMKQGAILLDDNQRAVVEQAVKEVCIYRQYNLLAVNVRTNHFHAVVSAQSKPEPIADAFKSYATRKLRQSGVIGNQVRPWARGKSRRYLWKQKHVLEAIDYVLYGQGEIPLFDD
jgi:REP element-mobilizing transposase RayT